MDNFSAHELGVELSEAANELRYTKVMWLPANGTSIYQPLDQGIIQNWKCYVRRQFVTFMVNTFDGEKDLSKEMNVLRAIRWGIAAWENDVTPATIQNCWARSQAIDFGQFPLPAVPINPDPWTDSRDLVDDMRTRLQAMHQRGIITTVPNIQEYISPYSGPWNETITDNGELEDLVEQVVSNYLPEEPEDGEEPEIMPQPIVTAAEALTALDVLRRYEESSELADPDFLRLLRAHEKEITRRQFQSRQQGSLGQWFIREIQ
jgi:hypothetical protein